MGIYKENIRKYMIGHQMRQVVSNNGVLDLAQFYLDATAVGAIQDKTLFEAELNALPDLAKNEAETILVPGIYKNGKVYGFNGATKGLVEFHFSRESSATYFDKNGVMQIAAPGMPRIDHNPVTKACRGYLIENSGMNLASDSGTLTGVANVNPRGGNVTAVDTGWNKGILLSKGVKLARAADQTTFAYKVCNPIAGVVYTCSVFIKVEGGSVPVIGSGLNSDLGFNVWGTTYYNQVKIEDYGDGVFRLSYTGLFESGNSHFGVLKNTLHSDKMITVTGFQAEVSASVGSYIPTIEESATIRAIEVLSSATDIVPFSNASMFMYMNMLSDVSSGNSAIFVGKTLSGRFLYYASSLSIPQAYDGINSVSALNAPENGVPKKIVSSYGNNGLRICAQGGPVGTNSYDGDFGSGNLTLSQGGVVFIKNHIKTVAIFSRQLNDQEHIDITV